MRQATRLRDYDCSSPGAYFVTICTHKRVNILRTISDGEMLLNQAGQIAATWWRLLPYRYPKISLDEYILIPDHMHGILHINDHQPIGVGGIPTDRECSRELEPCIKRRRMLLPMAIGYFKMNTATSINSLYGSSGYRIWQRGYYEHIIRGEAEMTRIQEYIINNPLAHELDHPTIFH